jgi:four helix bundle protein
VAVRHFRDLIAWQLAESFKDEVFRLVRESRRAEANQLFRDQLINAASAVGKDITEGFLRHSPRDLSRFIDYALGSLGEAELRLEDGITLGYFAADDCESARRYARRCLVAMIRLKQSQRQ